jgi:hypothetical protein
MEENEKAFVIAAIDIRVKEELEELRKAEKERKG